MITKLPTTVQKYIEASNAHDSKAVAACFNPEGEVHDEGKIHRGHESIGDWHQRSSAALQVTMKVLTWETHAHGGTFNAEVAGNFPGSPLQLSFDVTLGGGAIDRLEIAS